MQFTNPSSLSGPLIVQSVTDPVQVAGGTVDGVTNPVQTDPLSTVALVTTNVPILGRDYFYWPAISGEQFPPALSSMIYGERDDIPAWYNNNVAGAVATFPQMPRQNPVSGKQGARLAFQAWFSAGGVSNTASFFRWGQMIDLGIGPTRPLHMFSGVNSVANLTAGGLIPLAQWVSWQVDVLANGTINVYMNGALIFSVNVANGNWPLNQHSSTDVKPVLAAPGVANQFYYSQLQFTWI